MAEQASTTRPARRRSAGAQTAAKAPAAAKATPAKAAAKPAAAPAESKTNVTRFQVELEGTGDTKSYSKFTFPDSYKGVVVGNVYAPIGTSRVVVLVIGSDDVETADA